MSSLVPVPWQPNYYLTPDTLAYFMAASTRVGVNLRFTDAWRSYAEQKGYWDARVAYLAGRGPYAPPASNPDTGQRNHMRGAAGDLVRTDATVQAACRAVGLIRDADESWHWNNPNWPNMPIIPTNTSTAGGGSTPLPPIDTRDGFDMASLDDLKTIVKAEVDSAVATISDRLRREERGRLYYCATPPAGLPQYVIIFWQRNPGDHNVLYCNGGVDQADHLKDYYYQTADTTAQARAAALAPAQYGTLIALALGTDSAFTNAAAVKPQ